MRNIVIVSHILLYTVTKTNHFCIGFYLIELIKLFQRGSPTHFSLVLWMDSWLPWLRTTVLTEPRILRSVLYFRNWTQKIYSFCAFTFHKSRKSIKCTNQRFSIQIWGEISNSLLYQGTLSNHTNKLGHRSLTQGSVNLHVISSQSNDHFRVVTSFRHCCCSFNFCVKCALLFD